MARRSLAGLDRRRLRLWLAVFFLALALPAAVLVRHSYGQLKWEAFHQHQVQAEELATRVDARLVELVDREEARSFTDYAFLVVRGGASASYLLQRSALSELPVEPAFPGLIGHFQIDPDGGFSTPLLPAPAERTRDIGMAAPDRRERLTVEQRVREILARNELVEEGQRAVSAPEASVAEVEVASVAASAAAPAPAPAAAREKGLALADDAGAGVAIVAAGAKSASEELAPEEKTAQSAFDQLASIRSRAGRKAPRQSLGRVEDLNLARPYEAEQDRQIAAAPQRAAEPLLERRVVRKERGAAPAPAPLAQRLDEPARPLAPLRIATFESELDPFEFRQLDSGHFVLFRRVWQDGQRYIQGLLIDPERFLAGAFESAFRETALSRMSDLLAAYGGDVVSAFSGQDANRYLASAAELTGALLYRSRLSAPLGDLELIFSITSLPAGPGARVITVAAVILALVLCGGFYLMYRLALRQIELARQQQDFVSAVSHELKTPLTSIRMYGEMLREGWASEDKKRAYYDYIFHESERLSRLIGNVLQLARMTRNDLAPDLVPATAGEIVDGIRSKIASQVERAGFELDVSCSEAAAAAVVRVDLDFVSQILINLVDNAVKFSRKAGRKAIDIGCRRQSDGSVVLTVRDYGPGVQRDQMRKIFVLFYRSENELTRETVGTGIGLSLVHQLALSMGGKVDVVNRDPGAEFRVTLPAQP